MSPKKQTIQMNQESEAPKTLDPRWKSDLKTQQENFEKVRPLIQEGAERCKDLCEVWIERCDALLDSCKSGNADNDITREMLTRPDRFSVDGVISWILETDESPSDSQKSFNRVASKAEIHGSVTGDSGSDDAQSNISSCVGSPIAGNKIADCELDPKETNEVPDEGSNTDMSIPSDQQYTDDQNHKATKEIYLMEAKSLMQRIDIPFFAFAACMCHSKTYDGTETWWKKVDNELRKRPSVLPGDLRAEFIMEEHCNRCKEWTDFAENSRLKAYDDKCYLRRLKALIAMGLYTDYSFSLISRILALIDPTLENAKITWDPYEIKTIKSNAIKEIDPYAVKETYQDMKEGRAQNGNQEFFNKIKADGKKRNQTLLTMCEKLASVVIKEEELNGVKADMRLRVLNDTWRTLDLY